MTTLERPAVIRIQGRRKVWEIPPPVALQQAADPTVSRMVTHLLHQRSIVDPAEIQAFVDGVDVDHDPLLLPDMADAAARIRMAVQSRDRVALYGDFDCDGLTSAAILLETLRYLGADPIVIIPTRDDGHGLQREQLGRLAERGVKLVVTSDCGITAVEEVEEAHRLGVEVIVTDHHQPRADAVLPRCLVVSPTRPDSDYPWPFLSGAGVAYKLAQVLLSAPEQERLLDLVALGTVADVVPLRDENRSLVVKGLGQLRRTERPGLRALFTVAGVSSERLNQTSVAYYLGPRINAANRMASPQEAFELITCDDPVEAQRLATLLDQHNSSRQLQVERHLADLSERIGDPVELVVAIQDGRRPPILCVDGAWPPGVSGLLASELTERYGVPAIAASTTQGDVVPASGRSVDGVDILRLVEAVDAAEPAIFGRFGGHSRACGFSVEPDRLRAEFDLLEQNARERIDVEELGAGLRVDARVRLQQVGMHAVEQVERLAPYGSGFEEPVFVVQGVYLQHRRALGSCEPDRAPRHMRAVAKSGSTRVDALMFRCDPELFGYPEDQPVDLAFSIERNEWNQYVSPQIRIHDWRPFDGDTRELKWKRPRDSSGPLMAKFANGSGLGEEHPPG